MLLLQASHLLVTGGVFAVSRRGTVEGQLLPTGHLLQTGEHRRMPAANAGEAKLQFRSPLVTGERR